jgi:hypothetical protein
MISGYAGDLVGLPVLPWVLAGVWFVSTVAAFILFRAPRRSADRRSGAVELGGFLVVTAAPFAYFVWLASPSMLPITNGPDLVHHLQLIHFIQLAHRLPHDPALAPYLLEMMAYTPGSHILAATIAGIFGIDAVRIVHCFTSACAAISLGLVYVVTLRVVDSTSTPGRAAWQSLAAPLLALVPVAFALDAFTHFFFFAQVVSETFTLGMLLASVNWVRGDGRRSLWLIAICAAGVLLSWPVWIGPAIAAVIAAGWTGASAGRRGWAPVIALLPAAAIAFVHATFHRGSGGILTASGAMTVPSIAAFGIPLLAFVAIGCAFSARIREQRVVLVFALAVVGQAVALAILARIAGSGSLYLPFKMLFLAVPVAGVIAAVGLAGLARILFGSIDRLTWAAAVAPVLVAAFLLHGRAPTRRLHGPITDAAIDAGAWARDHVPGACVDYFASSWLTGYWMHLDALGNPRVSDRMRSESFDFRDAVGKWIEGRGLPFAFVEDFDAVPRDARVGMTILQRYGRAAVVANARHAACTDSSPSIWTLAARR